MPGTDQARPLQPVRPFKERVLVMVAQASERIHEAIRRIFDEACQSDTPLSTVGLRCTDLRADPAWKAAEVDKVGDAVLRLLALHLRSGSQQPAKESES